MSKVLLQEDYFLPTRLSEEVSDDSKHYYFEGIYAQAELENRNGRNYPLSVLKEAVDEYRREYINTNRALGQLEHPNDLVISMDRACIRILNLDQDPENPNNFIGKSLILDGTPMGDLVIGLLRGGTQLGVSTRGAGSLDSNHMVEVLQLVSVDVVLNPSAPDAFQNAIYEEQEYTNKFEFSKKKKFLEDYKRLVESAALNQQKLSNKRKLKLLEEFLK